MILVDTSIWIDHLHRADPRLGVLLMRRLALVHPLVMGELACARLARRATILAALRHLPPAPAATNEEVLVLIERRALHRRGLGFVDAHLLAAALIGDLVLWTRDRALLAASDLLHIANDPGTPLD